MTILEWEKVFAMVTQPQIDDLKTEYQDRNTLWNGIIGNIDLALTTHRNERDRLSPLLTKARAMKKAGNSLASGFSSVFSSIGFDPADRAAKIAELDIFLSNPTRSLPGVSLGSFRSLLVTPLPQKKLVQFERALKSGDYDKARQIMQQMQPTGIRAFLMGRAGRAALQRTIADGIAMVDAYKNAKTEMPRLERSLRSAEGKMARQIKAFLKRPESADYIAALRSSGTPHAAAIADILDECRTAASTAGLLTFKNTAIRRVLKRERGNIRSSEWNAVFSDFSRHFSSRHATLSTEISKVGARISACERLHKTATRKQYLEMHMPFGKAGRQSVYALLDQIGAGGTLHVMNERVFARAGQKASAFINLSDLQHDVGEIANLHFDPSTLRWKGPGLSAAAAAGLNTTASRTQATAADMASTLRGLFSAVVHSPVGRAVGHQANDMWIGMQMATDDLHRHVQNVARILNASLRDAALTLVQTMKRYSPI